MDNGLTFDGSNRFPIVSPAAIPELSELVRQSAMDGRALYPFGGRTMLDLGLNPTKPGTAVDMRQLNQVIDYPARDMTITVQAGIVLSHLRDVLLAEKQRLPVDIPCIDRATLGGAIATNASGSRRFGLGTLRDYVIGISAINDEGAEFKGGGRVVKNVAGYDFMKLYTGSLGTLGIITQVKLKLKPLPESSRLLVLPTTLEDASGIFDALLSSRTRPVCIDLLNPQANQFLLDAPASGWAFAVGYEDNHKAVTWQVEQLKRELSTVHRSGLRECEDKEADSLWTCLTDFALLPQAEFSFKANVRPSAVIDFCKQASASVPEVSLQAHAGNGIVVGHCRKLDLEQAQALLAKLGLSAEAANGNLIVTRCPPAWKSALPVWGRRTSDRALMRTIKDTLDPGNIFNPGRFVDGI